MLYPLFRPLLFALDPETAHDMAFAALDAAAQLGARAGSRAARCRRRRSTAMGLAFPNRVGLAAGLDKNAAHIDGLAALGFGFIECGTVTPRAQPGNPRPRLFRLPEAEALINRLGFNNDGVERFLANVGARSGGSGILGLNIGKNFDTPNARAVDDYLACLRAVYARASLRHRQHLVAEHQGAARAAGGRCARRRCWRRSRTSRRRSPQQHGKYTPIVVKIAPDLTPPALDGHRAAPRPASRRRRDRDQHDDRARRRAGLAARRRSRAACPDAPLRAQRRPR